MVDKVVCYVKKQQAESDEELLDDVATKKEQARLLHKHVVAGLLLVAGSFGGRLYFSAEDGQLYGRENESTIRCGYYRLANYGYAHNILCGFYRPVPKLKRCSARSASGHKGHEIVSVDDFYYNIFKWLMRCHLSLDPKLRSDNDALLKVLVEEWPFKFHFNPRYSIFKAQEAIKNSKFRWGQDVDLVGAQGLRHCRKAIKFLVDNAEKLGYWNTPKIVDKKPRSNWFPVQEACCFHYQQKLADDKEGRPAQEKVIRSEKIIPSVDEGCSTSGALLASAASNRGTDSSSNNSTPENSDRVPGQAVTPKRPAPVRSESNQPAARQIFVEQVAKRPRRSSVVVTDEDECDSGSEIEIRRPLRLSRKRKGVDEPKPGPSRPTRPSGESVSSGGKKRKEPLSSESDSVPSSDLKKKFRAPTLIGSLTTSPSEESGSDNDDVEDTRSTDTQPSSDDDDERQVPDLSKGDISDEWSDASTSTMPNLHNLFEEKRVALKGNESQSAAEKIGEETAATDALDSPTQPTPPTPMVTSAAPDPLFSIQTPDLLTRVIVAKKPRLGCSPVFNYEQLLIGAASEKARLAQGKKVRRSENIIPPVYKGCSRNGGKGKSVKVSVKETVPVTESDSEPMTPDGPATPTCVLIESSSDGSESSNDAYKTYKLWTELSVSNNRRFTPVSSNGEQSSSEESESCNNAYETYKRSREHSVSNNRIITAASSKRATPSISPDVPGRNHEKRMETVETSSDEMLQSKQSKANSNESPVLTQSVEMESKKRQVDESHWMSEEDESFTSLENSPGVIRSPVPETHKSIGESKELRFVEKIVEGCEKIGNWDGKDVYALPLTSSTPLNTGTRDMKRFVFEEDDRRKERKTILLVGVADSGKTALINSMINYIFGVEWDDPFRLQVKDCSMSKASELGHDHNRMNSVSIYDIHHSDELRIPFTLTIVDAPDFSGNPSEDEEIVELMDRFFQWEFGIETLDLVGVVAQAHSTKPAKIFETILSNFGKDLKENIKILFTFADNEEPSVLETQLPCQNDINSKKPINFKFNWEMKSDPNSHLNDFDHLFASLATMKTKSLEMTKQIAGRRKRVKVAMDGLQSLVQTGQEHQDEIKKIEKIIRDSRAKIDAAENSDKLTHKIDLPDGLYVTNCDKCSVTCSLYRAALLNSPSCPFCPKKCDWNSHTIKATCWLESDPIPPKGKRKNAAELKNLQEAQNLLKAFQNDAEANGRALLRQRSLVPLHVEQHDAIALCPFAITLNYLKLMGIAEEMEKFLAGSSNRIKTLRNRPPMTPKSPVHHYYLR